MDKTNGRYLIERLNNGVDLNIVFMSHNAYWPQVELLKEQYDNCKVQIYGKGYSYLIMDNLSKMSRYDRPIDDADLIIFYSCSLDSLEYEFTKMKSLAYSISKEKKKPITIGCSFYNPDYKIVDWHQEHVIKLVKINNNIESEDKIIVLDLQPIDLVNVVLIKHDNIDCKKIKRLQKNV